MKGQHRYYDRISQVRMLRGVILSLLLCLALMVWAVTITGAQVEALEEQVAEMTTALMAVEK